VTAPARVRPVVVGVDSTDASWPAVLTGAWEAHNRGAPLCLAHGSQIGLASWPLTMAAIYPEGADPLAAADQDLRAVADPVSRRYPDLTVRTRSWLGGAAAGLVELSHDAELLVVGARGSGGAAGLPTGSVAAQTAAHASCPVIVVRPPGLVGDDLVVPRPGPVVVGVDGSPASEAALTFALGEARLRDTALIAVNSWWEFPDQALAPAGADVFDDMDEADAEARRRLAEAVAGVSSTYPEVVLQTRSVRDMTPSLALIELSRMAGLVVVGSRGRGGFASLVLGSVSRDVLATAQAPVAIVHRT
jgi:nucleotide-binding universal stress UspA family protein